MFRSNLRRSKDHNQRRPSARQLNDFERFRLVESWILMRFCIFLPRNCGSYHSFSNVRSSMEGILTCDHPTEVFCFFAFFLKRFFIYWALTISSTFRLSTRLIVGDFSFKTFPKDRLWILQNFLQHLLLVILLRPDDVDIKHDSLLGLLWPCLNLV